MYGARVTPGEHLVVVGTAWDALDARRRGLQLRDSVLILSPGPRFTWAFLFRNPLEGTVAETVLKYGTGGLRIDDCRIRVDGGSPTAKMRAHCRATGKAPITTRKAAESVALGRLERRGSPENFFVERPGESIGRWPTNLLLIHTPMCKQVGTKQVKGSGINLPEHHQNAPWSNGSFAQDSWTKTSMKRSCVGHVRPDGTEVVEAWECAEGCPVIRLDEQTGNLHPAGNKSPEVNHQHANKVYAGEWKTQNKNPNYHENEGGGASRFYPQFKSFEDALDWLVLLIGL